MLIFLIGFMGSGKSYTGKRLAHLLGYDFIDLDRMLEEGEKRSISSIFKEEGESRFRELERQYLQTLGNRQHLVLATGGGTPCQVENLEWMKAHGLIIYLKASPALLAHRLSKETQDRPLIAGLKNQELLTFIEKKLRERHAAYESADIVVEQEEGMDAAELISKRLFGK